ncbi:MAG: peptidoglycan DD-metalloendopeptidase family protein [Candidatus Komeilibacteria bacterium]|jgi:peptidoglycan hydrolase-like protein with peptidoglycan-binding domain|nr:peptidoglycan DD-metalloendopeptidase family protein [Candidatus Komeilibacteria bacterium]MBT4447629.1 peptidoglycan DD-metalloendopeptidase family protein [Candidatus Komeilibacteria bacterium]
MYKIIIFLLIFILNIPIARAIEARDITFPVEDGWDYNFSDTYGAARSGGRSHIGTDIMVDQMTPLVAAVDGRVSYLVDSDKGWGLAIYIEDKQGYSYRYLHVNNDTPGTDDGKGIRAYAFPRNIKRGSIVKAGDVIAFAGNSGNAEWTGHHLHFEIWTPQKKSINSYPSLMAAIGKPVETIQDNITTYQFTRDLKLGIEGEDVRQLQKYLNSNGFLVSISGIGSIGNESDYFGSATQAALIKFQQAESISPAAGYFGPLTRGVVNNDNSQTIEDSEIKEDDSDSIVKIGWLVRDKKLARVYYMNSNLELEWVVSEEVAVKHFGDKWYEDVRFFDDLESMGMRFGDHLL